MAVVIVNYRVADHTLNAVRSALASSVPVSVIVVENDSGDDSYERLKAAQRDLEFTLVKSPKNGGFAYGCNRGMEKAQDAGYIFFLNPDALIEPSTIEKLVDHLEHASHVGIVGAQLVDEDGTPRSSAWRFPTVLGELERGARSGPITRVLQRAATTLPIPTQASKVDWVTGAAFMVRRQVIEQVGPMDENFFLYYEETDWCWRTTKAGWTVTTIPKARVIHHRGKSTGVTGTNLTALPDYVYQSRRYLLSKHNGPEYLLLADLAYLLGTSLWRTRCVVQRKPYDMPPRDVRKFIRAMFSPMPSAPTKPKPPAEHGASNENPSDMHLLELLWEDFNTHDRSLLEPGFWALLVHRLGNARMDVARPWRSPLTVGYNVAATAIRHGFGIKLDYTVRVGRRLRIWHHGAMVIGAEEIGDDVHLRQSTTIGTATRRRPHDRPSLGNGVEVGSGACIVGKIKVGHHARIGANAVVAQDVPPFARIKNPSPVARPSSTLTPPKDTRPNGRSEGPHRAFVEAHEPQ